MASDNPDPAGSQANLSQLNQNLAHQVNMSSRSRTQTPLGRQGRSSHAASRIRTPRSSKVDYRLPDPNAMDSDDEAQITLPRKRAGSVGGILPNKRGADDGESQQGGDTESGQPPKKRVRKFISNNEVGNQLVHVGYHQEQNLIKVYAKLQANGNLYAQVFETENLPAEVLNDERWSKLFIGDARVKIEMITLKPELFPADSDIIRDLNKASKRDLIKKYLTSQNPEPQSSGSDAVEDEAVIESELETVVEQQRPDIIGAGTTLKTEMKTVDGRAHLQVGRYKDEQVIVPVQAVVQSNANCAPYIKFVMFKDDAKSSSYALHKLTITDPTNIFFNEEFATLEIDEAKAKMMTYFDPKPLEAVEQRSVSPPETSPTTHADPEKQLEQDNIPGTIVLTPSRQRKERNGESGGASIMNDSLAAMDIANGAWNKAAAKCKGELVESRSILEQDRSDMKLQEHNIKEREETLVATEAACKKSEHLLKTIKDREDKVKAKEASITEREDSLIKQEAEMGEARVAYEISSYAKYSQLKERNEQLEGLLSSAEAKCERLQNQVEQLEGKIKNQPHQRSFPSDGNSIVPAKPLQPKGRSSTPAAHPPPPALLSQPTSPQPLILNNQTFANTFARIPPGKPNAGLYWENHPENFDPMGGPLKGNRFQKRRILQAIDAFAVDGELQVGSVRYDGVDYSKYVKDDVVKLVRDFGPQSIVHHEGQFYLCWITLKQVVKEYDF